MEQTRIGESRKGMIDPTPLWDEDGKVYLIHAYAGSRKRSEQHFGNL